jgi:hypothetical protein
MGNRRQNGQIIRTVGSFAIGSIGASAETSSESGLRINLAQ